MNNWYVITGAPCSGKTTLLKGLEKRGMTILPEVARVLIDKSLEEGITIDELRKDELSFQEKILNEKIKLEQNLDKNAPVFLDRGIPDSYAYFKLLNIEDETILKKSLGNNYKKVFILDPCAYKEDYARTESPEDQAKLHLLLEEAYKKSGGEIISVPIFSTKEERVDFVLNNL